MIKCSAYIEKYDWWVYCFIAVSHYDVDEILACLSAIGCDGYTMLDAEMKLRENELNSGLTYSSRVNRASVMVTAIADSAEQQFNTFIHEICHVGCHIANASYIDKNTEEFAYLLGDFSMSLFPKVKGLLCDCCRSKKDRHYD